MTNKKTSKAALPAAIVGALAALAGLIVMRLDPSRKTVAFVLIGLGVFFIVLYVYLDYRSLGESARSRSTRYSLNALAQVLLFAAILGTLAWFSEKHFVKKDLTDVGLYTLLPQSVKILEGLKKDVEVIAFFREDDFQREKLNILLDSYALHSKHFNYRIVNPDKHPSLAMKHGIDETARDATVFTCGEQTTRTTVRDEESFTNALISVTREKKKEICFLTGHGERPLKGAEPERYEKAKKALEKQGFGVKEISLYDKDAPDECVVLVIAGAKKTPMDQEIKRIDEFLGRGRGLFAGVDPSPDSDLGGYLERYGVSLSDDIVVDTISQVAGLNYLAPAILQYVQHPVNKGFNLMTFYPMARTLTVMGDRPEGLRAQCVGSTSEQSWAKPSGDLDHPDYNPETDKLGPLCLMAVVEEFLNITRKKDLPPPPAGAGVETEESGADAETTPAAPTPAAPEAEETPGADEGEPKIRTARLVIFGDSDFASNRLFGFQGNGDLFLNSISWLAEEEDLISIRPRSRETSRLEAFSDAQAGLVFIVSVILVPLLVMGLGVGVWFYRRRL